jgi:hypothetical protein
MPLEGRAVDVTPGAAEATPQVAGPEAAGTTGVPTEPTFRACANGFERNIAYQ